MGNDQAQYKGQKIDDDDQGAVGGDKAQHEIGDSLPECGGANRGGQQVGPHDQKGAGSGQRSQDDRGFRYLQDNQKDKIQTGNVPAVTDLECPEHDGHDGKGECFPTLDRQTVQREGETHQGQYHSKNQTT